MGGGGRRLQLVKVLQQVASCSAALLIAILHVNGAGGGGTSELFERFSFGVVRLARVMRL